MTTETQAHDPAQGAPRPFIAVKAFADSVLAMLDERIKTADRGTHPFNDYFGDKPEAIVTAKAQASELREVRTQVRMLGDRALVDLMKFKPAIPAPEGAQLPPLPHPLLIAGGGQSWFNAEQMHAYARVALAAPAPQATDAELERRTGEPHVDGWPLVSGLPSPAEAHGVAAQVALELERIANDPPISGNMLGDSAVMHVITREQP